MLLSPGVVQAPSREDWGSTQGLSAIPKGVLPVGAVYGGHSYVPVFGRQSFILSTVSQTRARITLVGPMNLDEEIRAVLMTHGGWLVSANFTRLVIGCIEAKFCK